MSKAELEVLHARIPRDVLPGYQNEPHRSGRKMLLARYLFIAIAMCVVGEAWPLVRHTGLVGLSPGPRLLAPSVGHRSRCLYSQLRQRLYLWPVPGRVDRGHFIDFIC